jgi:phospholipid/cholesterol/gamma-HCH transport system substrate-binding protein
MMANGADATEQLKPLLTQLSTTAESIEGMADSIASAGDSLDEYIDRSGSGVQQFSQQTLPELGSLVTELRQLANTLKNVSEKLEDDPTALLYGNTSQPLGPGE